MRWAALALIVLAILATFSVVYSATFTNWDDTLNVVNNPHLKPPTTDGLAFFWLHAYQHEYIPLPYTIWWVLVHFRVAGPNGHGNFLDPRLFHAINLLLHIGAALIVFRLLRLLTGRQWPACAGALLFALHPLQTEPVAWVTGLKDVLCGLFSMAALWEYVLFAKTDGNPTELRSTPPVRRRLMPRQGHYLLALLALLAALFSKPSAVTLPLVALAIDRLLLGRPWKQIAISLIPFCALSAVFAVVTLQIQSGAAFDAGPLWSRPLVAGDALAFYISKLLLPIGLCAVYPHSVGKVLASPMLWAAWLVPAALIILAWVLRRRAPWLAASVFILIAALLPVLGLVPFEYERDSTVADRYMYVAMLGPSLALAFGLARLEARQSAVALRWVAAVCIAALASLAVLSSVQARTWHDSRSLFARVVEIDPDNIVAIGNLASDEMDHGNLQAAEHDARHALDVAPNAIVNRLLLAQILLREGRKDEAAGEFFKVYQLDKRNVVALTYLSLDLERRGRLKDALTICSGALQLDPQYPDAHRAMAILLARAGQKSQALQQAAEAVRLEPSSADNRGVYAQMLLENGRNDEAQQQLDAARAIRPNVNAP